MHSTRLTQIAKQLCLIYNGDPWYGRSITYVLESTDPQQAFKAPAESSHSIAELASHMIAWRTFAVRRLQGDDKFNVNQEESFNWQHYSINWAGAWKMLLRDLEKNQQELIASLDEIDDSVLEQTVACKPYDFDYMLSGIINHDLYHLGQIAYIQKIQQGRDLNREDM